MDKHYKKAPIKEAILDLKVILPENFTVEKILEIHERIRDRFPTSQLVYLSSINLQPGGSIQEGLGIQVNSNQQHSGFLFRSKDNLEVLQATSQGFTFNRLAPYESWETFSSTAKELWEIYKSVCQPAFVTRAAIRYVNQIDIPINGTIDFQDYLKTVPEVPSDMPQANLSAFFMQLQIPQEDLDCMLIINENFTPPAAPDLFTVILDIDLFRQSVWQSGDENIWLFLEQLRRRKNQVFRASITEKAEELFD